MSFLLVVDREEGRPGPRGGRVEAVKLQAEDQAAAAAEALAHPLAVRGRGGKLLLVETVEELAVVDVEAARAAAVLEQRRQMFLQLKAEFEPGPPANPGPPQG